MTEEESLLSAAKIDPTSRLVYADWLDEHDRPIEAATQRVIAEPDDDRHRLNFAAAHESVGSIQRAWFVRLQLEQAALNPNTLTSPDHIKNRDPRCLCRWCQIARETLEIGLAVGNNWAPTGWFSKFDTDQSTYEKATAYWRRGFACRAACTPRQWIAHGEDLLKTHPVRSVFFTESPFLELPEYPNHPARSFWKYLTDDFPGIDFKWSSDNHDVIPCGYTVVPSSGWVIERRDSHSIDTFTDRPTRPTHSYILSLTFRLEAGSPPPRVGDTFGPINATLRHQCQSESGFYAVEHAVITNSYATYNSSGVFLSTVEALACGPVHDAF